MVEAPGSPPPSPASAGQSRGTLGRYVLLDELGRGGMGVVYRALDTRLRREVALKTILAEGDATATKRFLREAEAVARLRHPNVVSVHEAGEVEGRRFIAMDLIAGRTLDRGVADGLPLAAAVAVVRDVARAVQHAHEHGIVHRDLKPQNVMIDATGRAVVLDFGLARVRGPGATRVTKTGAAMGTPAYMPPEQASGAGDVNERSDVYSLGATLFHALARRPPFDGDTEYDVIAALLTKEPPSPRAFDPSVPRDLETVALKCLEKDPARRYASAGEVADELDRFLADEPPGPGGGFRVAIDAPPE